MANNDVNANVHINEDVVTIPRDVYDSLVEQLKTFRSMFSLYHVSWSEDKWGLRLSALNKHQRSLLKTIFKEEVDDDAAFEKLMETCVAQESWEDTFYMYTRALNSDRNNNAE